DATHSTKAWMNFMIVKSLLPYNGIIGRPGLKAIQAVSSTVHGILKFPTEEGIVTIRSASVDTSSTSPSDMTGVPRSVAEHRLNVREGCPPVRQKKRGQAPERTKAIQAEVEKLVVAGIMREVYYHDWLSNPVMIEAKTMAMITDGQVKKFLWDNIVCRFGIPGEIISDNGKQFANNPFKDWCDKLNITQHFVSVKHPQSNELVERANRSLGEVIRAEIGMPTYRTTAVDVVNNDEELRLNLDLLEERRELVAMNEARSKSKMMKYYNSRVRGVAFKPGDFFYRSNNASHAVVSGKLGPKWEGLYEVTDALGNKAYKLRSMDGMMLPRTWNVTNLKRCYL
nr:reverse transcriptase domain-containing protein [Tanacetum cinerariifolium]